MPSAAEVLAGLPLDLALVVHRGEPHEVTRVAVHDPAARPAPGALLAAVGVRPEEAQVALLRDAARVPVAGVVLGGPWTGAVSAAAGELGLTVAVLDEGADWAALIAAAHAALHGQAARAHDPIDLYQRLFELTEEVADLLGAALIVEDHKNRVVAYSSTRGPHDDARTQTILGREMPARFVSRLRATGAFRRLASSDEPFVVPAEAPDFLQRVVVPLRLGPEFVGSIWAIREQDLGDDLRRRLAAPARALAVCLLRLRAEERPASRYSVERVRSALTDAAADAALALPGEATRVVALGPGDGTSADDDLSVWRATLRRHSWAHPILTEIDGAVFALVTDGAGAGGWGWLRSIGEHAGLGVVGASRAARTAAELPARRWEAAEVARTAAAAGLAVAAYEDVWPAIVIRRSRQAVSADAHDEVRDLVATDARGDLAATLAAWLTSWGDHARAAQQLQVHPNTVRLRMRRIHEVLPHVDLEDPDQRLALTLLLLSAGARDDPATPPPRGGR